jgi:hypothetical protein
MSVTTVEAQPARPAFFRLPKSGGDCHFGFSRSFYYNGELRGWWRLVRIKDEGKERGVTLVPYKDVLNFICAKEAEAKQASSLAQAEGAVRTSAHKGS